MIASASFSEGSSATGSSPEALAKIAATAREGYRSILRVTDSSRRGFGVSFEDWRDRTPANTVNRAVAPAAGPLKTKPTAAAAAPTRTNASVRQCSASMSRECSGITSRIWRGTAAGGSRWGSLGTQHGAASATIRASAQGRFPRRRCSQRPPSTPPLRLQN